MSIETFYEVMRRQGISPRSFLKCFSLTAASLGLAPAFASRIAYAMEQSACWEDRVGYYIYLVGQGRIEESQKLLLESLTGKKASTKILENSSSSSYTDKSCR